MNGLGPSLFEFVVMVVVVVLVINLGYRTYRYFGPDRSVTVTSEIRLAATIDDVDAFIFRKLGKGIRSGMVTMPAPRAYAVTVRRTPGWVGIPMVLLFPVGFLFLLWKTSLVMTVVASQTADGVVVRTTGWSIDSVARPFIRSLADIAVLPESAAPGRAR